ncbi:cytochrome c oxidase subunit V [Schizosaccharomyces japonicus yFS275]|uniref:Cytochrome c oxidase subunit V n=1 Tax=Schizosaccharomyces japonicus (strain yFS275 / FY16936) TaxID=402676 RepID=B6JXE9_SCHJY|nr:cytochrome c oxidase subunit V [Schizosaccharomyces japonicus yFS275]EEB06050.1 cytochrome c oxidase subunit V [Schizosaccharomyces japonicus yFS275]
MYRLFGKRALSQLLKETQNGRTRFASNLAAFGVKEKQTTSPEILAGGVIARPRIVDIEKRWSKMPKDEQDSIIADLEERQKKPWDDLTLEEKRAAYWIAFGNYGPREQRPINQKTVFFGTMGGIVAGLLLFALARSQASPTPRTMTKEWQEKSNEYMKENKINPISGAGSENYKGRGAVSGGLFSPREKDKK